MAVIHSLGIFFPFYYAKAVLCAPTFSASFVCFFIASCAKKLQTTAAIPSTHTPIEALPVSEINIPIQVNLNPLFALAEKSVDTVFTSPNYPADWVIADCATRYKYRFRRSALQLKAAGAAFNLGFTGFYKIIGSTRVCVNGTVLSPWTPPCSCGFSEGERKVAIGFTGSFALRSDHLLHLQITRSEPQPVNKCTVCFWGQDITTSVMTGLKNELDLSKKAIEDSFGTINLKPYLQQAWNQLTEVYNLPYLGYLSLQPHTLHMENIAAQNNLLNINLGITATPVITFEKKTTVRQVVPNLSAGGNNNGFSIHMEAAFQYDSLSKVINGYLVKKRFELSEGIISKYVIVENCKIYSNLYDKLVVEVDFSGSYKGKVFFTGKPVYDAATKKIELQEFDYDLQTRSFLLNTAKWLFDKRIVTEIKKYTSIDLAGYYQKAATGLDTWLNKEWTKGIRASGKVSTIELTGVFAQPQHLLVRSNCTGNLNVLISEIDLKL